MNLPYDIARCCGTAAALCKTCRRTEPGGPWQVHTVPMVSEDGCVNYLPTNGRLDSVDISRMQPIA